MSLLKILIPTALVVAIAVTAGFTSLAASSTVAYAGAGNFGVERTVPNYALHWENPLLAPIPAIPVFGQ